MSVWMRSDRDDAGAFADGAVDAIPPSVTARPAPPRHLCVGEGPPRLRLDAVLPVDLALPVANVHGLENGPGSPHRGQAAARRLKGWCPQARQVVVNWPGTRPG